MSAILAHPGQTITFNGRPRRLGPTEHWVRCSRCEAPTIVLAAGDIGEGVLCEACLCVRRSP